MSSKSKATKFYIAEDFEGLEIQQVNDEISKHDLIGINVSVSSARQNLDLASYYLDASFIIEALHRLGVVNACESPKAASSYHYFELNLILKPSNNKEGLAEFLYWWSLYELGEDEGYQDGLIDQIETYSINHFEYELKYPDLLDSYYANLMVGYKEIAGDYSNYYEFLHNHFSKNPEHQYGYWVSASSKKFSTKFYVSSEAWIVPIESDIPQIMKVYGGLSSFTFYEAEFISLRQSGFLISNSQIVRLPFGAFLRAKSCTEKALKFHELYLWDENQWMDKVLPQFISNDQPVKTNGKSVSVIEKGDIFGRYRFYVSEFGDSVIISDYEYCYIFWETEKLNQAELLELNEFVSKIFSTTSFLAGIQVEIACPWNSLDDEQFEELCYDLIYHNPKYDNTTIRKMGRSRSRDGGRDIVVHTKQRPGYEPEKYIFQCKLTNSRSLSTSNIGSVSDVIDQYGVKGYGIMTSTVIDSTLYDRLDGISQNRDIRIDTFSVYEIERFLGMHPNLKARHFGTDKG